MLNEATLYLQLLVGLIDKEGNQYSRDDLVALATEYGFDGTIVSSQADPAIDCAPMISRELLGIWLGKQEPSVLFLQMLPTDDMAQYRTATERFRSLVKAILKELNQDAVYWFPALRRPFQNAFENVLLMPATISHAEDLNFPDTRQVFGRQVFKTLSVMRGPSRSGRPSLLVYQSDWEGAPLFVPNSDWTPAYGELGQKELIEANIRERYPFARDLTLQITREAEWRSSQMKMTGDRLKARTFGEFANYTFQFALIDATKLRMSDPQEEYRDLKGRKCIFRTMEELLADSATRSQNSDVLPVVSGQNSNRFNWLEAGSRSI